MIQEYEDKINKETLKSFKDTPDDIKEVYVCKASNTSIEISWDAPEDNNSKITGYNIYLSDKTIENVG
jgi:hypothetical protein